MLMMRSHVMKICAFAITLAALSGSGACGCTPTAPAAPQASFNGTVTGGRLVFHTLDVGGSTDSVDVEVRWTNPDVRLRVIQIDASCEPLTAQTCRWLSDPGEPAPNSTARAISYSANHQGADATGRVRVMIENLTATVDTPYTVVLTAQHHGTDC